MFLSIWLKSRKTFWLFLFLVNFINNIYSQLSELDVGSMSVLIHTGSGSGSGFYLQDTINNSIYLVTASHVLVNPQTRSFYSDSILLISYKKNSQRDSRDSFKVSLLSAYNLGVFKFNEVKDVAVLKLANSDKGRIVYSSIIQKITSSSTYLNPIIYSQKKLIKDVNTLADVYTIGYPKSLTLTRNFDFNRPLVRKGIISGIDLATGRIIADCPTYQGNSGGIVLEINVFSGDYWLVGIVSQFVPFEEHWMNEAYRYYNTNIYNSGYTVVAPVDVIEELKKEID